MSFLNNEAAKLSSPGTYFILLHKRTEWGSVLGGGRDCDLSRRAQVRSGSHVASYPVDKGGPFWYVEYVDSAATHLDQVMRPTMYVFVSR
jgi:hypothetical protein